MDTLKILSRMTRKFRINYQNYGIISGCGLITNVGVASIIDRSDRYHFNT